MTALSKLERENIRRSVQGGGGFEDAVSERKEPFKNSILDQNLFSESQLYLQSQDRESLPQVDNLNPFDNTPTADSAGG